MNRSLHLALTGPFGSGCTTLAEGVLQQDPYFFKMISLSSYVKQAWSERNDNKDPKEAKRSELQDVGNRLREENDDRSILANKAVEEAKKTTNRSTDSLVFDSIRNLAEVDYLRQEYRDLYLIGMCSSENDRWLRSQGRYQEKGLTPSDFKADEERDQNEDNPFGQQVALCMHEADLSIANDNEAMSAGVSITKHLDDKLATYIELLKGTLRTPSEREWIMSLAHNTSLKSECFKRQVGAVIVDDRANIISVGYNSNPKPLKPCWDDHGDCYRIIQIEKGLDELNHCPSCGKPLHEKKRHYNCPSCGKDLYKIMFPDRAMSLCTALHAEEMAILNASGRNLKGCLMYTTTFPCFTCAQKIVNVGIGKVVYVESYPDLHSVQLFDKLKDTEQRVTTTKFEGIKARAYDRLFGHWRQVTEDQITIKKRNRTSG
ncbi:deaminase [Candidatus Bathyarchaeota archaeon]|nr:deaminase [Candidatus Bathyarchaeota archaeon]